MRGKFRSSFSPFFTMVYINELDSWYLLGGNNTRENNLLYTNRQLKVRCPMPVEKSFFPAVYHKGLIYTFGGYESFEKQQLSSCEYYDVKADKWYNSHAPTFKLA